MPICSPNYVTDFRPELSARPLSPSLREVPLPTGRGKGWVRTSSSSVSRDLSLRLSMPTAPLALPPTLDAHQALGSPSGRAGAKRLRGLTAPILPTGYPQNHRTDSTQKLPTEPPHRFLIRNCIPAQTVCTSLSPSLREVPLPEGEARAVCKLQTER